MRYTPKFSEGSSSIDPDRFPFMKTNPAAVEKTIWSAKAEIEITRAFLKEQPLFRKEQRETRQVNLLFIGFNLGKIGIQGHIEREVICKSILHI